MNALALLALLAAAPAIAAESAAPIAYPVHAPRVIDGDTLEIEVEIWPGLRLRTRLRLAGVNAPEARGPVTACELDAGRAAKAYTQQWIDARAGRLAVTRAGTDKYGRLLGHLRAGSEDLATALIAAQHGRPYRGERRQPWCRP